MLMFRLQLQFNPGGFSNDSIFPETSKYIAKKKGFFRRAKHDEIYRSLVDAILAIILPDLKPLIFAYYEGESKKRAKDVFSREQIIALDKVIFNILKAMFFENTVDTNLINEIITTVMEGENS